MEGDPEGAQPAMAGNTAAQAPHPTSSSSWVPRKVLRHPALVTYPSLTQSYDRWRGTLDGPDLNFMPIPLALVGNVSLT